MLNHNHSSPQSPNRVVVLGAAGFIGSTTCALLTTKNIPVLALGRKEIDLLSAGASDTLAGFLRPEDSLVVISAVAPVKNNEMLEQNISMMSVVCSALETVKPAHVVYVSSDAVYADSMRSLSETSCAQPGSLHGVMHLAREVMLEATYDGPFAIVRPTLIYGHNDPHNGYGPNRFRRLAAANEEIILFGEGEERRDHVLVDDVAELICRVLMHKSEGILNIATGNVTSFRDIAEMVVAQFDSGVAIKGSPRQGEMPHNGFRPFDPAETLKAFGDFEYTSLQDGTVKEHNKIMENK